MKLCRGACLVRARDDDWLYSASSPSSPTETAGGTWLQCSVVTAKQGGSCYILFLPPYVLFLSLFLHVCFTQPTPFLFIPLFSSTCVYISPAYPRFPRSTLSLFPFSSNIPPIPIVSPTLTNCYPSSFHQRLSLSLPPRDLPSHFYTVTPHPFQPP